METTFNPEISRKQKLFGWALSAAVVYLAQALIWGILWGVGTLSPENQASTHWTLKVAGGFYFGAIVGLIPAGLVFFLTYSIPAAFLWATVHRDSIWLRRPMISCMGGALLGIGAVRLFMAVIGEFSNTWSEWRSVLIMGGLYGVATSVTCLLVAKKMVHQRELPS